MKVRSCLRPLRPLIGAVARLRIDAHLFVLCPNNSGSTFLMRALSTCRATWSLSTEGQLQSGFRGPIPRDMGRGYIWAGTAHWVDEMQAPGAYDWEANRRAWCRNARPHGSMSSILVEKSPPNLLLADQLQVHFEDPRFCIMVRHPLAVIEGILRARQEMPTPEDRDIRVVAAQHIGRCLEQQVSNIERLGERAVFFSYETMCDDPVGAANLVRTLCPELDDLDFDIEIPIKNRYSERPRNMNDDQIARLDPEARAIAVRELQPYARALEYFGHSL